MSVLQGVDPETELFLALFPTFLLFLPLLVQAIKEALVLKADIQHIYLNRHGGRLLIPGR